MIRPLRSRPTAIAAIALALALVSVRAGFAQTSSATFPIVNGTINAQLVSGSTLFLAGTFSSIGPQTGGGVPVDSVTGLVQPSFPRVVGQVSAAVSDGAGGWYIGGLFTTVGGFPRSNLAHILADRSVSAWNPGTDAQVLSLSNGGGVIYVGGAFANAGGLARARIAAIDTGTALATSWNPGANDVVRALLSRGNVVYAGGRFANIGAANRSRIAAIDSSSGLATSWNPNASLDVFALAERGGTVYAGGSFTQVGGVTHNRLAAIDSVTGSAAGWAPNVSGQVSAIELGSSTIYIGGVFLVVGGQSRARIAEVSLATGSPTTWNPAAGAAVSSLALSGGTVYAGGDFLTIGGQSRSRLAALNVVGTGTATSWDPVAYGTVAALVRDGSGTIYAGGTFGGMGGTPRNNLAAVDLTNDSITAWDAQVVGSQVLVLEKHGGVLYFGGNFSSVGGQPRANVAAVDLLTAAVRPWNPGTDAQVSALAANDSLVYVGGFFGTVGGQPRANLSQVSAATGVVTSWDPTADNQVFEIRDGGDVVLVGGSFNFIGGTLRNYLAAIDIHTGAATAWDPEPNGTIRSLVKRCDQVYVAGFFTTIGPASRGSIAAIDVATGAASSWNPNCNGPVFDIEFGDGALYVGGVFSSVGGQSRNRLAAIDPVTGAATTWNPNCNGTVRTVVPGGGQVSAGGAFTAMGTTPISNLSSLPADHTYGCGVIAVTPGTLPVGVVGSAYSSSVSASGGTAPYCYAITEGSLPAGLSLSPSTGQITGTPLATADAVLTVTSTDARGCTGTATCSLVIFGSAPTATIGPDAHGLCVNAAHPFVRVPIVYTRTDNTPVRLVSVTFQIQTSILKLRTPSAPGTSVRLGSWFNAFPNSILQVVDNGGGSYTADATILGLPCGQTTGGQVLTVDVAGAGPDGMGGLIVTSVSVRDCSNSPVGALVGPADSVRVQLTPLVILPATLPGGTTGTAYHQVFSASLGVPPLTFSRTSGTLPTGVTLSSAGVLDGIPTAAGAYAFTVGVSDTFGTAGSRAYSVNVDCVAMAITTSIVPDAIQDSAYTLPFTASGGVAPLSWSVSAGSLPDGLALEPSTGVVSGTPSVTGTSSFTITATDHYGCTASHASAMTVFTGPIAARVAAHGNGLCVSGGAHAVAVPFVLDRVDPATVRRVRVTFRPDPARLALATPSSPDSSVQVGSWFTGFPAPSVTVTSEGLGAYTADISIPGEPCGPIDGGVLFSAKVVAVGLVDGPATIEVLAVKLFGCAGDTLPVWPGTATPLQVNHTAPAAIANLAASQVTSGNGPGSTTGIVVTWTGGAGGAVSLYRAPWASYPLYAATSPPDSGLAPGGPWVLVSAAATSPVLDHPGTRGFWYYVALVSDSCGNVSVVSNRTSGTLDYQLGDVSDAATPGTGNNSVGLEDMTLLGMNYGITGATLASRGVEYLDVGPTTDGFLTSRPVPDHALDFEDLMVFIGNFNEVLTAPLAVLPATPEGAIAAPERFRLQAPSLVTAGDGVTATLRVTAAGRMWGFSTRLAWNPLVLEPVDVRSSGFVEGQGGLALSPGPGRIDAALLGRRQAGLSGEGDVATFRFRALRTGDPALRLAQVLGRDGSNRPVPPEALDQADASSAPHELLLLAPAPNPFTLRVALAFALPRAGQAELDIYDVNGRHIRALASGPHAAGVYHLEWDGLDDSRAAVPQGVYYVRFAAGDRRITTRIVHLK